MPIEFRCSRCGKLLRTGDDTAGRQAQCPECGTISLVPNIGEPNESAIPSLMPLNSGNPFADGATTPGNESSNPYQSPNAAFGPSPSDRVSGPAVALIVTAILGIVVNLGIAALYGFVLVMALSGQVREINPQHDAGETAVSIGSIVAGALLGLTLSVVVLIGANKMRKLESYGFAMAAAIIAVIPCTSPCCWLGLPFGIWAIVVLSDVSVKGAFRR
jgi:DNA-directed RNA polymerase subunit RPC12/RpoP